MRFNPEPEYDWVALGLGGPRRNQNNGGRRGSDGRRVQQPPPAKAQNKALAAGIILQAFSEPFNKVRVPLQFKSGPQTVISPPLPLN